ncbi:MAG TPA: hypothetical protein VJ771_05740 [Candidatus Nitrosotalea sp.]|nr:hypothetical protein [Candidatus Nitrosotalea sp.]
MVSWDYNWPVGSRKVQCPECGKEIIAKMKYCQCTNKECRHRFIADDHIYKTPDDRLKERQEMFKTLDEMEARFEKDIQTIRILKQKLKPLNSPKHKEKQPEPTQPAVIQ